MIHAVEPRYMIFLGLLVAALALGTLSSWQERRRGTEGSKVLQWVGVSCVLGFWLMFIVIVIGNSMNGGGTYVGPAGDDFSDGYDVPAGR